MKRKVLLSALAIVSIISFGVIKSNNKKLSDVTLANIFAISNAQAEGTDDTGPTIYNDCPGSGDSYTVGCESFNSSPCNIKSCDN